MAPLLEPLQRKTKPGMSYLGKLMEPIPNHGNGAAPLKDIGTLPTTPNKDSLKDFSLDISTLAKSMKPPPIQLDGLLESLVETKPQINLELLQSSQMIPIMPSDMQLVPTPNIPKHPFSFFLFNHLLFAIPQKSNK